MLVKKIYLIILFFFLQDVIELIIWFCVGYFFGHVFFYAFIKAKKKTLQIFLRNINRKWQENLV